MEGGKSSNACRAGAIVSVITLLLTLVKTSVTLSAADELWLAEGWKAFKVKYNRQYNASEEVFRQEQWRKKTLFIRDHNTAADLGVYGFRVGEMRWSDWTDEEVRHRLAGLKPVMSVRPPVVHPTYTGTVKSASELPVKIDWRDSGWIGPVRDQEKNLHKHCGSCYAYATVEAVAAQLANVTKSKYIALSQQNVIDCSENQGCDYGDLRHSFEYILETGVNLLDDYPDDSNTNGLAGSCRFNPRATVVKISQAFVISPKPGTGELVLQEAIARIGPCAIGIFASRDNFETYSGGIFEDPNGCRSGKPDHAMLIVGYGFDPSTNKPVWIMKNSWGRTWGNNGYMLLARDGKNLFCLPANLGTHPMFPIITDPPQIKRRPTVRRLRPLRRGGSATHPSSSQSLVGLLAILVIVAVEPTRTLHFCSDFSDLI